MFRYRESNWMRTSQGRRTKENVRSMFRYSSKPNICLQTLSENDNITQKFDFLSNKYFEK